MRRSFAALAALSVALLVGVAGVRGQVDASTTRNPTVGVTYRNADGMYTDATMMSQVLLSYGMEEQAVSCIFRPSRPTETVTSATVNVAKKHIITNRPDVVQADAGSFAGVPLTNMTFTLAMEGQVGMSAYTLVVVTDVDTYTLEGMVEVGGFVLKYNGRVVSGEDNALQLGNVFEVAAKPMMKLGVMAKTFGSSPSWEDVQIEVSSMDGVDYKQVEYDSSCSSTGYDGSRLADGCGAGFTPDGKAFGLKLSPYRVGTGAFKFILKWPSMELDGEYFVTELIVRMDTSKTAPCVAMGGDVKVDAGGGMLSVDMFNLVSPPAPSTVDKVVLSYGGKSYDHDARKSKLVQPDQTIVFRVGEGVAGESFDAKLQCVFGARSMEAKYLGGKLRVSVTGKPDLARIEPLPVKGNMTRLAVLVELDRYEPATYTVAVHNKCVAAMVGLLGVSADEVGLGSVTPGSAISQLEVYTDKDCDTEKEVVMDAWGGDGCEAARAMDEPCGSVRVLDVFCLANDGSGVSGVAPGTVAAGATLASWAIALVAVLGALVVLVLVCLALWVVYRRSSDSSASEYSSSGPLGVPDPDDLLYNESVVRDVYGRSNGAGPTAEAVAERAKEAELREEFPRPPSTSAASGRDTADASSTYTV